MSSRFRCPSTCFCLREVSRRQLRPGRQRWLLLRVGILCLVPTSMWANPTGGSVAGGAAKIAGQGTSAVTITQTSNLAVINWKSFSINSGQSTSFLQPGANSAVLNRVLGGQTSLINGTLSANGQVYLINGNGIIVGPGGMINASAFTASTRDITDADFLSGHLHFTGSTSAGVQNLGTINALGGNIVLIGKTVDNEGTMTAPKGTAGLIAGDDVLLAQANADGSTITVSPSAAATSASGQVGVKNGGAITAAAAELKAANGNIYALAVQNEGTIRATTVSHQGGHIWLTSDAGTVRNSGTLNASATAAGGRGGTVTMKSATGTASHTGKILAQGGQGGVGGNAEISGANVEFTGEVDLTAPGGVRGTLLLDPATIDIVTGGGTDLTASTIDPSAIVLALDDADVNLTATTSITVDDAVDASGNSGTGNLTLTALVLNLNAGITLIGNLNGTATTVNVGPGGLVQNGVDAVANGGTVNLASVATYNLPGEIVINRDVDIEGNGATLNGGGSTRLMEVDKASVTLDNLTLTGGNGNSTAGAAGDNFGGDGGALLVYGQGGTTMVTITNCSFVDNSANSGGAIYSVAVSTAATNVVSISDSTFSLNSAMTGSAVCDAAMLGGSASMKLTEDTISGNSGTGAIYTNTDAVSNGAAVVSIDDTILAGNMDSGGESDYVNGMGGSLADLDYNLYGQNGNPGGFVPATTSMHDVLVNVGIANVLDPIGSYGGLTPFMPLVAGSPALMAGNKTYVGTVDQRGVSRGSAADFTDGGTDIGAVEAQFVDAQADPVTVVYGTVPTLSYTITNGPATAILTGSPELFTVAINVGTYPGDIQQGTLMASPGYILNFTAGDLMIKQRLVTVEPDPGQGKTYGTPDPVLTYTTDPATPASGLINGDTLSGALSYAGTGTFTSVGNYPITLGTLANSNYFVLLGTPTPTFAVTARPVTVDPDAGQGKVYGTPDPVLTYSTDPATTTSGLINGDTLSGAISYNGTGQFANAGNYAINLGTLSNSNYAIGLSAVAPTFTISPRLVTVTPDPGQGKIYGTPDPVLTYTITPADASTGLVNGDTLSGDVSYLGAGQFAPAGAYPISQGTLSNSNYVVGLSGVPATFTISPRSVTVYPDAGQQKVYGSPDPALTYATDAATATTGLVNGDTLSGGLSYNGAGMFAPVGTYTINPGTLGGGNYAVSLGATPTFAITPATLVYVADAFTVPVGGPFPVFTGTVSGFLGRDSLAAATTGTLTFTTPVTPAAPAGNYPIDGSGLSANNYTFVQAATNLGALMIVGGGNTTTGTTPVTTTMPTTMRVMPVIPAPSEPATPISQAAAQNTPQTTNPGPNGLPTGPNAPAPPPPPPSDEGGGSPISANEIVAAAPEGPTTDDSDSGGGVGGDTGGLAQGSSFTQAAAESPAPGGTPGSSGGAGPAGSSTPAGGKGPAGAAKTAGATAPAETPVALGPAKIVAPGQTITLTAHGSAAANIPPPVMIQTQFQHGFSPETRNTLSAAMAASKAAAKATAKVTDQPVLKAPPGGAMVAAGQTLRLTARGGAAVFAPPPVMVQTQFDAGFSSQSRDELARAAGL